MDDHYLDLDGKGVGRFATCLGHTSLILAMIMERLEGMTGVGKLGKNESGND